MSRPKRFLDYRDARTPRGKARNAFLEPTTEWFASASGVTRRISECLKPANPKQFNSKYADLIDPSDVEWFARMTGGSDLIVGNNEDALLEKYTHDPEPKKADSILSYVPIQCPISNCGEVFLPNDMILHFLGFHFERSAPVQQLFEYQRLIMTVKPYELIPGQIVCLGLVSYGGKEGESQKLAKRRAYAMPNLSMHRELAHLKNDLPIFVLASAVSMGVFCRQNEISELGPLEMPEFLMIWLAGAGANSAMASLTAFDCSGLNSRSVIVGVRPLAECPRSPRLICNADGGYFCIFFKQMPTFVDGEKNLHVELVLREGAK